MSRETSRTDAILPHGGRLDGARYGFAGMRDYNGELCFWPSLPEIFHCVRFNLIFKGQTLEVDVGHEVTHYTLKSGKVDDPP